jgi:hypothetical protein
MVNATAASYSLSRAEYPLHVILTPRHSIPPLRSVQLISISLGSVSNSQNTRNEMARTTRSPDGEDTVERRVTDRVIITREETKPA